MQAEVWKREQEKAVEARKLEEMKKEIAEERRAQELTDQAAEAGHVTKQERLEFMYKGGPGMGGPGFGMGGAPMGIQSEDQDAYLLGEKKYVAPKEDDAITKLQNAPGSLLAAPELAKNEQWNKLNADPLLMMRAQEQEVRKVVTSNPAQMARMRKALSLKKSEKKAKKRLKKDAKKDAKREKKERIRAEVRRKVLGDVHDSEKRSEKRSKRRRSPSSSSDSSSDSDSDSRRHRHRGDRRGGRERSRSRDRRDERRDERRDDRRGDRRDDQREDDRRDDRRDRRRDDRRDRSRSQSHERDAPHVVRDGASAQDASKGYGLTFANERGERAAQVRVASRNDWRENTRDERAEEEAKSLREKKEKEDRWAEQRKKGGSRNTVGHKTGMMSETERAVRLAAMSTDAATHDEHRVERLHNNRKEEEKSGEKSLGDLAASAPERHHSSAAPFLEKAQKDAFAFGGEGAKSLEERIGTTKYYAQKKGGD